MKNIAVKGCILSLAVAKINDTKPEPTPSDTVTCDKKGVYYEKVKVEIKGYGTTTAGASAITDNNGEGKGYILGSAKNVFVDNKPVVLEGDSVKITVNGTSTSGSTVTPVTEIVTVKIISAGQTSVQAE